MSITPDAATVRPVPACGEATDMLDVSELRGEEDMRAGEDGRQLVRNFIDVAARDDAGSVRRTAVRSTMARKATSNVRKMLHSVLTSTGEKMGETHPVLPLVLIN
eukprot:3454798-Pleurochrysis_carterae.AAC.2